MTDGWTEWNCLAEIYWYICHFKQLISYLKIMENIVEVFGEENIVQIMRDNKAYYKAIGEIVMKNERSSTEPTCIGLC